MSKLFFIQFFVLLYYYNFVSFQFIGVTFNFYQTISIISTRTIRTHNICRIMLYINCLKLIIFKTQIFQSYHQILLYFIIYLDKTFKT